MVPNSSSYGGKVMGPACPKCGLKKDTRIISFNRETKKMKCRCESCKYDWTLDTGY